jgi:hypothetical protein
VLAPFVGLKGATTYYGHCDTCGWKWVVPGYAKDRPFFSISAAHVPTPVPSLFGVGSWAEPTLAASASRWLELVGTPGLKGIKGAEMAIVSAEPIERAPVYVPRPAEKRAATAPASWFA